MAHGLQCLRDGRACCPVVPKQLVICRFLRFQRRRSRCCFNSMFHWTGTGCFESSYIGTQKHVIFDPKGLELLKTMIMSRTLCYIERLLAPYEVVERSCAIFCILINFARYKINMCVGTESVTVFKSVTEW